MTPYEAAMAVVDPADDATEEDYYAGLQALIDSGSAWRLEGSVGRAAMDAIESGHCVLGPEGLRDYWGGYVPSRFEVLSGTKGSVEYAESQRLIREAGG